MSIFCDIPFRNSLAASSMRSGSFRLRRKSPPVPLGIMPSSAEPPDFMIPLVTSEIVPSPPQAMIKLRPFLTSSLAMISPSPGVFVNSTENGPKCVRMALASAAQFLPVRPPADAGFTIINGSWAVIWKKGLTTEAQGRRTGGGEKGRWGELPSRDTPRLPYSLSPFLPFSDLCHCACVEIHLIFSAIFPATSRGPVRRALRFLPLLLHRSSYMFGRDFSLRESW